MSFEVGERFEATVGSVAHGGHCVARVDGRVAFVRHALPGELVVIAVTEDRGGSFFRADAVEVLRAAPGRVEPPCPVAGPGGCGGCDFQHATVATQRELKAAVVREQLSRLGGVDREVTVEALTGDGPGGESQGTGPDDALRWRTRTRFAVDDRGRPGFRAHRSHRVIPVDDCPITVSECVEPVVRQRFAPRGEVSAVRDARGAVTVLETLPARSGRRGRPHVVSGDGAAVQRVGDREFRLSAGAFWQVHPAAAGTFAAAVGEFAAARAGECAWDLYGGVGLFGAVLAAQVGADGAVAVVESSRGAVADGRSTTGDLPQVSFVAGDVARVVASGTLPAPDVVVLDPPRKGAGAPVVDAVAAAGPRRIVYVACDPAALGRDVALLRAHGYELRELRAFDAFPMTHHVECVALLCPE